MEPCKVGAEGEVPICLCNMCINILFLEMEKTVNRQPSNIPSAHAVLPRSIVSSS